MSISNYHKLRRFLFIVITVAATSSISLLGGIGLELVKEKILPLIPLIIALPALNTMVGDYSAIIASHAGDPKDTKKTRKKLIKALSRAIWVNILGIIILSLVLAARREYIFEQIFILKFVIFVVISMITTIVLMYAITRLLDKILEERKLNSDDVLIPVVTTVSDVMMLGLITLSVGLIF